LVYDDRRSRGFARRTNDFRPSVLSAAGRLGYVSGGGLSRSLGCDFEYEGCIRA
jgi:hypothetical protein